MAPPGVFSFYDNLDKSNSPSSSSSSLLLSPFSSFPKCISHTSVFSEHNYFFTNMDSKVNKTSSEIYTRGDCFDLDIPSKDKNNSEVMTLLSLSEDSVVSPYPPSNGDGEVSDNVFNDVTLVNRLEPPVSCDTDFLQGLDELDFDFDECEPSRGVSLESFIDAALEDTMDVSFPDHNNNGSKDNFQWNNVEEEEDLYKKEFFLKHLRLQRLSPKPTTSSRNRKRKHEESESNFSHQPLRPSSLSLRIPEPVTVGLHHPTPHITNTTTTTTSNSSPIILTSTPSHSHSNTYNVLTPLSVPSKLCSCASADWKRTILYSTAKSSNVVSVQTSPSTASVSGISSYRGVPRFSPQRHSSDSGTASFQDNNCGRLSPSLIISDRTKDCFEFDLLDNSEMDEDTKDLLQWLDNQETQTTIAGMTSSSSHTSPSIPSNRHFSSTTSDMISEDDLDAILSPKSQQSSLEMDTFQDLEAYVTEESTPIDNKDKETGRIVADDDNDSAMFPKSQIRLSILADISKDFLNAEYKERKEAIKRDILKSCQSNQVPCYSTNNPHQIMSERSDCVSEYWSDSPFSTSSLSSSSSSPSSSPPYSPSESLPKLSPTSQDFVSNKQSKNMELLNLFSDENAFWCL